MFINDLFGRGRVTESRVNEVDYTDNKFKDMMGKVAQTKTPQQHMAELEHVLRELKWAKEDIQNITSQIKYDKLPQEIMVKVDEFVKPFRPYIDEIDYQDRFEAVRDAFNNLQSAIYGLDDLIKYAEHRVNAQMVDIQDEIDYPDDEDNLNEAYYNDIKHAWNSGMSEEELIQRFGRANVEALKRKYGDNSIPTDEVRGYRSSNRVPEDPRVRAHRGLDGMGKRLKDIIKRERTNESLRDGEYYVYEVTFDDGTTTKIKSSNDWFDAKEYYAKRGKNVVKSERIGGIQGGDYMPPKKPHQFPDDSFARAQRAYDRQEPKEGVAEGTDGLTFQQQRGKWYCFRKTLNASPVGVGDTREEAEDNYRRKTDPDYGGPEERARILNVLRNADKKGVAEGSEQRWLIKIWDGNSNLEIERKGSYEQVRNSLVGLPHSHIVSIEPIEQKGVEEGYQDDSKEREENLRYDRSRNPVAADIRKKLNPNREFSEREIQQWASKSPENKEIYDEYQKINHLAKKAWAEKDGAAYTGLQNKRYYLRKLIGERMSDHSENKDVE